MSRIRGKNTKPELLVYHYLRKNRIYFQKHYRSKEKIVIDLALPRKKKAVFIDGDFWHGRTLDRVVERRGEGDFWTLKLRRNIERDNEQRSRLYANGWQIMTVWESDLMRKRTQLECLTSIATFFCEENPPGNTSPYGSVWHPAE